jgi:hypothetical protein
MRIVNSVFQYTDATNSAATAQPRQIDVLIDSAGEAPSAIAIAPTSIFAPSAADASMYEKLDQGVHSFVARLAGDTRSQSSFYTNVNNTQYLPRQYLTSVTPYTLVVAGIVPVTAPEGAAQVLTPTTAVPFTAVTDDPFPPPLVNGTYQTRFRVINAAPYAAATGLGATVSIYLTPGTTPPATVTGLTASGTALYRNASVYINADAGPYVITLSSGTTILARSAVTFAAGEVRTFVLQSTGYAATPSPANQILQALIDNKY